MQMYKIIIQYDIAEIWVTRHTEHQFLQEQVQRLIKEGYQVVIYRSGREDLSQMTSELLQANRY